MPRPKQALHDADAAFVGTVIEQRGDVFVFAVEEAVKGQFGTRVEVRDIAPPVSSLGHLPGPGSRVGLHLRLSTGFEWTAISCDVTTPEALRAAGAAGPGPCLAPRVTSVRRVRSPGTRLCISVADGDGRLRGVRITWGDGRIARKPVTTADGRRGRVTIAHGKRRQVTIVAESLPGEGCGTFRETSRPRRVG